MAAHCVLDGIVWYRRRNSVLLSARATNARYENHRGGGSRRGDGGFCIHGNGRGVAAVDRDCTGAHGGVSAFFGVAGLVDGAICAGGVLLVAGGVAADADAGFGRRGRGQRGTAVSGISAVLPLVVCAWVASIYRSVGDFLFNGGKAETVRLLWGLLYIRRCKTRFALGRSNSDAACQIEPGRIKITADHLSFAHSGLCRESSLRGERDAENWRTPKLG
jgi:hypothetical protein